MLRLKRTLIIALIAIVWCAVAVQPPLWIQKIERWSLDRHLRSLPWTATEPPIVLIEAGEKTFAQLKAWPWSRFHHARLLDRLREADTVVVDILFPEAGDAAADKALAEAVRQHGRTVTAMHLVETAPEEALRPVLPYPELRAATRQTGYTNVTPDIDGLVRFTVPLRKMTQQAPNEKWIPSLSLLAAQQVLNAPAAEISQQRNGNHVLQLGSHKIPLDAHGRLWLQYAPHHYPVYEYADVLAGRWPSGTFRGKVVVIGVAASGADDFFMIPGADENPIISGAHLNAEIIRNLINGQAPTKARPITDLLFTLTLVLAAARLGMSAHRWRSSGIFLALCMAYFGLNRYLFVGHLHWVNLTVPLLAGGTGFFSALFLQHHWQQANLAFRTYSMDAILKLSASKLSASQTLEDYLSSIWPEIEKATGIAIVSVRTTLAAIGGNASTEQWQGSRSPGEIIEIRGRSLRQHGRRIRHQILIPYADTETGATTTYLHLGSQQPIPQALSETLATLVTAISWFFNNLQASRRRKKMLMDTIHAIFTAMDYKDPITGGHSNRVSDISKEIIDALDLDPVQAEDIYLGSLIHDIGKIGIPDSILNKPGKLTDAEFDQVRIHPDIGKEIMAKVELPKETMEALYHHHERYDGNGYPQGLRGEEISLAGRIVALADVFDALSAERPYRGPMPLESVCEFIEQHAGTQFDPQIARVLLKLKSVKQKSH